jgi:hypothetical protein
MAAKPVVKAVAALVLVSPQRSLVSGDSVNICGDRTPAIVRS